MTKGKNQYVTKHENGWQVKGAGNIKATVVANTRAQVIKVAREIAKNQNSELVIHGTDGKIRQKDSQGGDPSNIKG